MNKILKGNLVFLSILLLLTLVFIKNYNKIILFILILTFYLEIIFITREFLKYINLDEVTKEKKVSNRGYNKNKFIKKVL